MSTKSVAGTSASNVGIVTHAVTVFQRSGFVTVSVGAAERFAMRCLEIEGEPPRNTAEQFDLKQYCSSVVVLSAAAIEAFKNELLLDRVSEPLKLKQKAAEKHVTKGNPSPRDTPKPLRHIHGFLCFQGKPGLDY